MCCVPVGIKLCMVFWADIVPDDVDVHVAVGPAVLMVEPQRMHHLVLQRKQEEIDHKTA